MIFVLVIGSRPPASHAQIFSADGCADQYILRFLPTASDVAVSKDASANWSYFRDRAKSYKRAPSETETLIYAAPQTMLNQFGLDVYARAFIKRTGVTFLDIPWNTTLAEAENYAGQFCRKYAPPGYECPKARRIGFTKTDQTVLYITSGGVTAGPGTFVDNLITSAGLTNYQKRPGWHTIPIERLVASRLPDIIITAFFGENGQPKPRWSAAMHPALWGRLSRVKRLDISGALVSCNAWFSELLVHKLRAVADSIFDETSYETSPTNLQ